MNKRKIYLKNRMLLSELLTKELLALKEEHEKIVAELTSELRRRNYKYEHEIIHKKD